MDQECVERTEARTPNGGAYYIAHYFGRDGAPVPRMSAWYVEIHEFTCDDELIQKHWAYLGDPDEV